MSHVPGRPSGNMILWEAWGRLLGLAWGPLGASWNFLGASSGLTGLLGSLWKASGSRLGVGRGRRNVGWRSPSGRPVGAFFGRSQSSLGKPREEGGTFMSPEGLPGT